MGMKGEVKQDTTPHFLIERAFKGHTKYIHISRRRLLMESPRRF